MSSYAMNLLRTGKLKGKFSQRLAQQSAQPDIKFKHKGLHLVVRNGELLCLCNAQALPIMDWQGLCGNLVPDDPRSYG